eukprot:CAMPEP_0173089110 /NCGR_PEP_ID=MMETSP1102-20130122/25600_1 /TAXON_ID=49646 /ORGANISM="Geminigera sp., Strain Caron Lab Isolate" /LENGTH=44 /DNA_ID= /DNA_START= /DNA_END= /DNA_ORIENTATION=
MFTRDIAEQGPERAAREGVGVEDAHKLRGEVHAALEQHRVPRVA